MSNIKVIYSKKVHKMPLSVQSYTALIETITKIYPILNAPFVWAVVNQENPTDLQLISNEQQFQELKLFYSHQNWPTIKLLVTQDQNFQDCLKDNMPLLNQSIIIQDKKNADVGISNIPQQVDHQQQFAPIAQTQATQVQVKQVDTSQNTVKVQQQDQKVQKNEVDSINQEQLAQLVARLVDERLAYHGLVEKKPFSYRVVNLNPSILCIPSQMTKLDLTIQNNGTQEWHSAVLKCQKLNFQLPIGNVEQKEAITKEICFKAPAQFGIQGFELILFAYDLQQKQYQVGSPIVLNLNVLNKAFKDGAEQKVDEILAIFPQKGRVYIQQFVQKNGSEKTVDELIELLLSQQ